LAFFNVLKEKYTKFVQPSVTRHCIAPHVPTAIIVINSKKKNYTVFCTLSKWLSQETHFSVVIQIFELKIRIEPICSNLDCSDLRHNSGAKSRNLKSFWTRRSEFYPRQSMWHVTCAQCQSPCHQRLVQQAPIVRSEVHNGVSLPLSYEIGRHFTPDAVRRQNQVDELNTRGWSRSDVTHHVTAGRLVWSSHSSVLRYALPPRPSASR